MIGLRFQRNSVRYPNLKKTIERFYATSVEPLKKETYDENFEKELKKYDTLKHIIKRTRVKKPQREPFVKNLVIGVFDKDILTYPEMDLSEYRHMEKEVNKISDVLKQKHMVNVDSIGNKNFRQVLSDQRAIGLQASQFLDGRECCPMELACFLESLSEHQLRDNLLHHELLGVETINRFASDEHKRKYLYEAIKGEKVIAFALTGPQREDTTTHALLSEDKKHWTLNGTKSYVVNGISADTIVVFAITKFAPKDSEEENSLSAFIVEKDTPGVSWKKLEPCDIEIAEINFDHVKIPAENLIGKENAGDKILKPILRDFRLGCGPACITLSHQMMKNLYKSLVEFSSSDNDWISTEAVKARFGELSMDLYVAESVTYLTAGLLDYYEDQDVEIESAITKIMSSEAAYKISSMCLDMLGLPATLKNHWARKSHDDAINYLTLHETNDSLRMLIGLKGLQYAGYHLAPTIKKKRNPLFNAWYMMRFWFRGPDVQDKPRLNYELFGHLHPSLEEQSKHLEYCVKRLQFAAERILIKQGLECTNRHVDLRRIADVMCDCYAMTAVLARASRSYCIGLQFADFEITLANIFCRLTKDKVQYKVSQIIYDDVKVTDRNQIAFGKKMVEAKGWFLTHALKRFF